MSRNFFIRPCIGNTDLSIDGRMIPYPLVSAEEYLMARHENMTDEDMDEFVENHYGQYSMLNAIIAMKQSCFLLRHTKYSCDSLADHLYAHKNDMIAKYNETYQDEPFDEDFYEHYIDDLSVVYESLNGIDLSDMTMPICTIYEHPMDFPDKYVIRLMDACCGGQVKITNVVIVRDSLEECRNEVNKNGFSILFPRNADDDERIVESWMR
jgi:hypothetical protein